MSEWKTVPINTFLKERKNRFRPSEANELNQKRLYKIDFSGNIHILEDKTTNTNMILVKKGDLVISGINVEKGAVAVYEGKEYILATIHYSSYEFDKSKIDIGYFKWFLKSKQFKDIVNSQIRGGIKTELKPKKFLPLEIPLPDLPTQIKIRDKINNVVNEITELRDIDESNEEFIDKLRQSILQEAVSGKLVGQDPNDEPASELLKKIRAEKEKLIKEKKIKKEKPLPAISKEEIPYNLPKRWEWVRLGDVMDIIMGQSPPSNTYNQNSIGMPFYQGKTDFGKLFPLPRVWCDSPKKIAIKGDILISVRAPVGPTNLCNEESCIGRGLAAIRPIKTEVFYLLYFFRAIEYEFSRKGFGSTFSAISKKHLDIQIFPLPPLPEQKRIVAKVHQLMNLCDELEQQVKENQNNSELLMDAVLREAFEAKT